MLQPGCNHMHPMRAQVLHDLLGWFGRCQINIGYRALRQQVTHNAAHKTHGRQYRPQQRKRSLLARFKLADERLIRHNRPPPYARWERSCHSSTPPCRAHPDRPPALPELPARTTQRATGVPPAGMHPPCADGQIRGASLGAGFGGNIPHSPNRMFGICDHQLVHIRAKTQALRAPHAAPVQLHRQKRHVLYLNKSALKGGAQQVSPLCVPRQQGAKQAGHGLTPDL